MKFVLVLVLLVTVILSALVILVSAAQLLALAPPAAVLGRGAFVQKNVVNQSGLGSSDNVFFWLEGYLFCASNLGQGFFILDSFSCLLYKPPSNKVVPFPLLHRNILN